MPRAERAILPLLPDALALCSLLRGLSNLCVTWRQRFQIDGARFSFISVVDFRVLSWYLLLGGLLGVGASRGLFLGGENFLAVFRRLARLLAWSRSWLISSSGVHLAVRVVQDPCCLREVDQVDVFADEFGDDLAHVRHLRKCLEQGNHLEEAAVVWVIVP